MCVGECDSVCVCMTVCLSECESVRLTQCARIWQCVCVCVYDHACDSVWVKHRAFSHVPKSECVCVVLRVSVRV